MHETVWRSVLAEIEVNVSRGNFITWFKNTELIEERDGHVGAHAELHGVREDLDEPVTGSIVAGSSLKFCRVAEGAADLYPRFGPTMEWDTAAGQCILEQAGCSLNTFDTNQPLNYNKKNPENPFFIARNLN